MLINFDHLITYIIFFCSLFLARKFDAQATSANHTSGQQSCFSIPTVGSFVLQKQSDKILEKKTKNCCVLKTETPWAKLAKPKIASQC